MDCRSTNIPEWLFKQQPTEKADPGDGDISEYCYKILTARKFVDIVVKRNTQGHVYRDIIRQCHWKLGKYANDTSMNPIATGWKYGNQFSVGLGVTEKLRAIVAVKRD